MAKDRTNEAVEANEAQPRKKEDERYSPCSYRTSDEIRKNH